MYTMDCDTTDPSKILIVDDEPSSVLELSKVLGSLGEIYTASSGEEALLMVAQYLPDVIMLDIEMSGLDGFEVLKKIRSEPETRHIAIVFVTAHSQTENQILSLSQGAIDFIAKPVDHRVCELRVRNLLLLQQQTRKLAHARQEIVSLVNQVPSFISYWDEDWHNLYSNDNAGAWFGFSDGELINQHLSLIFPQTVINAMQRCHPNSQGQRQLTTSFEIGLHNLRYFVINWSETSYQNHSHGYLLTVIDISHQKQIESNLKQQNEFLDVIIGSVAEGVIATDENGLVTFINPKAELITGWRLRDGVGHPIEQIMQLRDPDTKINSENPIRVSLRQQRVTTMPLNSQLISRDGKLSQIELTAAPLRGHDGVINGAVTVIHDISHGVSLSLLRNQASSFDQLTSVANRLFIREKLQLSCEAVRNTKLIMAMAVIDIDRFKFFNDTHGNSTGDAVLKAMAKRLFDNYEPEDSIGRLGADEFMVIFRHEQNPDGLQHTLHTLLDLLRTPLDVEDERYSLSVSIGVSLIEPKSADPDTIMQQADAALYRAKFEGGDRYKVFSEELERSLMQRRSTEELLRNSLQNPDMIEVYYQPKVDLQSGSPVGAEALIRIRDYSGKLISPMEFIPIAEESGVITELGAEVLRQACQQCQSWIHAGFNIPVAVNISAVQCLNDDLIGLVRNVLYTTDIPPQMLELEVTETAFMRDIDESLNKFIQLKQMGVVLSIDDFGKGYSNLTYLRRLDVDKLKLDMSYVKGMLTQQRDYELVKTIISLGQSMGLELVAEGIESTAHRDTLLKLGCRFGQGFLYARPLSKQQFLDYLAHNTHQRIQA